MKTTSTKKNIANSNTALYCIFGNPVRHSLSPVMQNAAFRDSGLNAVYLAFQPANIKDAVQSMRVLGIRGASVTIPYKVDVIKHIDRLDPLAEKIGSVNTLLNENNKITGYNTDGIGAISALKNNNIKVKGASILIIGNGGSARAIAFALLEEGAGISIAGRNLDRIMPLVNDLRQLNEEIKYTLIADITEETLKNIDIIINATNVGMTPEINNTPIDTDLILKRHSVFDIIYSPDITELLRIAKNKGSRIIRGIEMLIYQGAEQFEIWTGKKAPVSVMEKAVRDHLK